ncbi:MAG: hypothetical protein IJQ34_06570 [Kiritimatiellae bacterium]|nr:hypothetical protein [Kiritimatiellia bacterium]
MKLLLTCFVCALGSAYAKANIAQGNSGYKTSIDARRPQRSQQATQTNFSPGRSSRADCDQTRMVGTTAQKASSKLGVRTALAAERLKYEPQKDGSYKVKVSVGNRRQFVYVWPNRRLESIAYIVPEENYTIPNGWIKTLNRNCMVEGEWLQKEVTVEVKREKVERNALVFVFSAADAERSKDLAEAIRTVAKIADDAEQEYSEFGDLN